MSASMPGQKFFAAAPKGVTALLVDELRAMGAESIVEGRAGVEFEGSLELGYRACLWSRPASRILLAIAEFDAPETEALYAGVRSLPWAEHMAPSGTLAVDFHCSRSRITHSHFGALRVKDGIVDRFRDLSGERPSVALSRPDLRVNVFLDRDVARVSIDLSGESLHRRGYREEAVEAPLKENLAAALLLRSGWPGIAQAGGALVDPMCGSGTLPIEAALIAGDIAPGLQRDYFGFLHWRGHDAQCWEALLAEARDRRERGRRRLPRIYGCDADPVAVRAALANRERAGLREVIHFERSELCNLARPANTGEVPGLVIANPPYGERLGEAGQLVPLYTQLGARLKEQFQGWQAAVFTGNPPLGRHLGLKARRTHVFYNGAIECRLLRFEVTPKWYEKNAGERIEAAAARPPSEGAEMFANRLRKNLRTLGRWAERHGVTCYRLYDTDMPEYALAVDLYHGEKRWAHVQEYAAPASIDPGKARTRLREALGALPLVLEIPREQVFFKRRERQRGPAQYGKLAETGEFHEVREGPCRLLVNFTDYLDTGLFLDHRLTRARIGELARGRRFLNLFAYTATATVYAALGGAAQSTSVDMSATYLDWARRNFTLNGLDPDRHELIQADCLVWLEEQSRRASGRSRFDLIFLDPPTFSNSKRMERSFDVQRDHTGLIGKTVELLAPQGVLIFSTNRQKFRLDAEVLAGVQVEDISASTIPEDFARNPKIHRCYKMARSRHL